jgi:hypothetical protein
VPTIVFIPIMILLLCKTVFFAVFTEYSSRVVRVFDGKAFVYCVNGGISIIHTIVIEMVVNFSHNFTAFFSVAFSHGMVLLF